MTTLIDGKKVSSQIRDKISQETAEFIEKTGIQPHLVVIIVDIHQHGINLHIS